MADEGDVDLNLLRYFVAVADAASFSKAAAQLGVPRPTVSRAVARLEDALGVRLLQRTTRHVALSTTGAAFYERVAPRLTALRCSIADVPELDEQPTGRLRVTCAVDVGAAVIADIAARFTARYPSIELEVSLSNTLVDIVAERYDAALRVSMRPLKDSTLSAKNLGAFVLQIYASPLYLARRGTPKTLADLGRHDWVRFRGADQVRLQGPDGKATIPRTGRLACDEMFFAREAVRAGAGLGLLPTFIAHAAVASGDLVRVLPRWSTPSGSLWFVSPSARQLPKKVLALRDFLSEHLML